MVCRYDNVESSLERDAEWPEQRSENPGIMTPAQLAAVIILGYVPSCFFAVASTETEKQIYLPTACPEYGALEAPTRGSICKTKRSETSARSD